MEIKLERTDEGVKVIKTIIPAPEVSEEMLSNEQLLESLQNIKQEIEQKEEAMKPLEQELDLLISHEAAINRFLKEEEDNVLNTETVSEEEEPGIPSSKEVQEILEQ